ncbi:hypothetical protein [Methylobacterium haplocladii]|uniref:hypothetical protein n=1 Tax=Methylobacterium haplocladii TaxID=1176176 RepID=UPI001EE083BD|nr:hypothetical protein [Methylobacterium haplocladii]GJD82362.1 hypothetical protein HPGCJGGD_0214 [Methylobacterium haplocladii]GLS61364.1 hypothetical protein GCM10007887_40720 [Methylobacterium haplocladii]
MSDVDRAREMRAPHSGSAWASVIVDPPSHPDVSNENTLDFTQLSGFDGEALLASIQAVGRHVRDLDVQTQAQRERIRELIAQVREHLRAAIERAEQAEARERDMQLQANAAVEAAEGRARVAEKLAQTAEAWLARIAETLRAELPIPQGEMEPSGCQKAA